MYVKHLLLINAVVKVIYKVEFLAAALIAEKVA